MGTAVVALPLSTAIGSTIAPSIERLRACRARPGLMPDPEDVHRARVAARRLRAQLKRLDAVVGLDVDDVRRELERVGGVLGVVRDTDVLRGSLMRALEGAPATVERGGTRLVAALDEERTKARDELAVTLAAEPFGSLLRRLDEVVLAVRNRREVAMEAEAVMRPVWRALKHRVDAAGSAPTDASLHQIRIGTKHARYAAELFLPIAGADAQRFVRRATVVQDLLGEHQDAVVAETWLLAREPVDPYEALAAGWLAGRAAAWRYITRDAWRPAWVSLSRSGTRFW